jgi:hypothetical protein
MATGAFQSSQLVWHHQADLVNSRVGPNSSLRPASIPHKRHTPQTRNGALSANRADCHPGTTGVVRQLGAGRRALRFDPLIRPNRRKCICTRAVSTEADEDVDKRSVQKGHGDEPPFKVVDGLEVILKEEGVPKRWVIVGLCFTAFLLCNMDRVSL